MIEYRREVTLDNVMTSGGNEEKVGRSDKLGKVQ